MKTTPDMVAKDWFLVGWFAAMEALREDPDNLPHLNSLPREKACRLGFKRGVQAYHENVDSFMAPHGE